MIATPPPAIVQLAPLPADVTGALHARLAWSPRGVFVIARRIGGVTRIDVVGGPQAAKVDGESVFEIGSVTKTMTGALLADAVRRGEVRLDEPIDALLPAGVRAPAYDGKKITLLDLATQRSGLPRLPANLDAAAADPYATYDRAKLFAFLNGYTLPRAPGAQYEYSNLGFGLLATLLSDRAHDSYAELARERVFVPLGMRDTAADTSLDARLVPGYDADGDPAPAWHFDALAGAGTVRSTARDLLTYASALLGGEDDALATDLRAATTPRADTGTGRIGLGWQIDERTGIVWHDGGTGGYRSFVGVRTATGSAVVVLSNVSLDPSAADIALHLLEPTFPIVGVSRPAAIELADAVLERYVGKYRLGPEAILDVARDGRGLTAQLTGQARYRIFPTSPTTFIWHVVDAKLAFTVAADGSVPSATLHQHGIDVPAPRIVP